MSPSDWQPDKSLDASGLRCPLPVLKARKVLLALSPGERLMVTATDPLATIDVPNFCREAGHTLLATDSRDGRHLFLIERGVLPP
jgi:tRNA 2-thiouridine synthesizing protein A